MSWEVANYVFHAYAEATDRNRLRQVFTHTQAFTETQVFPAELVQEEREDTDSSDSD